MLPMNNCGMSNTVYDSKPDDLYLLLLLRMDVLCSQHRFASRLAQSGMSV
jgi:hypothetical protein